jgi:hypothetical protein
MKTYLISYSFVGSAGYGTGRAYSEIPDGHKLTMRDVEAFEREIKTKNGFRSVGTIAVSELPGGVG